MSWSDDRDDDRNPYRAPRADPYGDERADVDPDLIRKLREQALALGVLWMLLGGAAIALAAVGLSGNPEIARRLGDDTELFLAITAMTGLVWCVLGFLTCLRRIWAVYVGLVLCYLSLLPNLISLNVCSAIILVVLILQAHRVIGWSRRLRAARMSLSDRG